MYTRLAKSEEKDSQKEFGDQWDEYARKTPAFIPGRKKLTINT
jgi:protein-S-isoprenylcysteine O-methyltransferase Ste14